MDSRGIPKQDLITLRPWGGWADSPTPAADAEKLVFVLRQALSVLSADGEIYFSLRMAQAWKSLKNQPALVEFKAELAHETGFELTFMDGHDEFVTFEGVIRPKVR